MTDHPSDDELAAFALDALERDEAAFLARHLEACARCRAEVDALREATSTLALTVPTVSPPPDMRARVLDRALRAESAPMVATPPVAVSTARPSVPVPPVQGSTARVSRAPWLAAAACALVAVGLGAAWLGERAERQALALAVAQADSVVQGQAAALDQRDSLLAQVLGPEVETTTLAATGAAPSMRLFLDRGRGVLVISARRLPPAPDGRTYQLWGIDRDGRAVGLGVFNTSDQGAAVVSLRVSADARFVVSAVTDEPAGGSPQPTTTPFLVGSWSDTE